jgi:hypothetical protein
MTQTVLISCYGVYDLEYRNTLQIQGLQSYFKAIYDHLKKIKDDLKSVVFCGGYRNLSTSEAESSRDYFLSLGQDFQKFPLLLNTSSNSLIRNLALGFLTANEGFESQNLLIICDNFRVERVKSLSKILFEDLELKIEIKGFERKDDHPHSNQKYQLETALLEDLNKPELGIWKQLLKNQTVK